jgi:hypothetical protein
MGPGEMQLYSFYSPGLTTGLYDIKTEQRINASGQPKIILPPLQSFLVTAPRFSIDSSLIHSTFPLPGVSAHPNILPHIVFNDPHLPWQTAIGVTTETDTMRVPWLATIVFEQSELQMTAQDSIFPGLQPGGPPKQSFTMSNNMTLAALTGSGLKCAVPDLRQSFAEDSTWSETKVDVIFPKMDLFLALFSDSASTQSINLDRYKYLAHARQVNTTHMTDSGVIDEGTFSIIFSHRTGPQFSTGAPPTTPKPCVVHVVSLDAVRDIPHSSLTLDNKRAALISLFSWTYDCFPPEAINFEDVMRAVGNNCEPFGTPKTTRDQAGQDLPSTVQRRVQDRIDDGYTLLRYRVQTGEETVALTRGPLTPRRVPEVSWLDVHSNTGEDLQIIDTALGVIDISYCAAWQLGKALAIADQAFCASLLRIRAQVYNFSTEQVKQEILSSRFEAATSERVIKSLPDTFQKLTTLASHAPAQTRWSRTSLIHSRYKFLDEKRDGENKKVQLSQKHLLSTIHSITSASDGTHFTELKDPNSTDWSLVLNWLLDKIYLEGIPPYYLIPDPTWLPSECIRFFYVDSKWLSAIVDGALSVANHLDKNDDTRMAIKTQLLKYLSHEIHPDLKHPPQVPAYGFYLRSVAVDVFPDLVVRAPWPDPKDPRAEVLRQVNVRKDVMFCLLDRTPKALQQVIISQPPHQQCFAFGHDGTFFEQSFELVLRKVYSVHTDKSMEEFPKVLYTRKPDGLSDIYDWNWRIIRLDNFAAVVLSTLQKALKDDPEIYNGTETNAALLGIELNDPIYRLTFTSPTAPTVASVGPGGLPMGPAVFPLPTEAVSAAASGDELSRPFKITPDIQPLRPQGPPRRTNLPLPSLLLRDRDPMGAVSMASADSASSATMPALQVDVYENMEKCLPRFSPLCFALGHVPSPIPGDADPKIVVLDPNGTDVIFRLVRNSNEQTSTDFISKIKLTIPLGNTSDCLLSAAPGMYSAKMLNNTRLLPIIRSDARSVTVELKPKPVTKLTLLAHSEDLSFVINGATVNIVAKDVTILIVELYTSKEGNSKVAMNDVHHVEAKAD